MLLPIILIIVGFSILLKSGDLFVNSATWIAEASGIPKFIIGVTLVSFATTIPELLVSTMAVTSGYVSLGIGNAVGSTICNAGLILALSIIALAGRVDDWRSFLIKSLMIFGALFALFLFTFNDLMLTKLDALLIFCIFLFFLYYNYNHMKAKSAEFKTRDDYVPHDKKQMSNKILWLIISAFGLIIGSRILINSATAIAEAFHIPHQIIGLTIVALGTSLPELTTTLTSIKKKEYSMSLGNIMGANILNLTMILPICTFISKNGLAIDLQHLNMLSQPIAQTVWIDLPVSFLISFIYIVPTFFKKKFKKWQGVLMLLIYFAYIIFLIMNM